MLDEKELTDDTLINSIEEVYNNRGAITEKMSFETQVDSRTATVNVIKSNIKA